MTSYTYSDTLYCGHCKKETHQTIYDSGHERDSSNNHQICLECGWILFGYSDEWFPLYNDKEENK